MRTLSKLSAGRGVSLPATANASSKVRVNIIFYIFPLAFIIFVFYTHYFSKHDKLIRIHDSNSTKTFAFVKRFDVNGLFPRGTTRHTSPALIVPCSTLPVITSPTPLIL